MRVDRIQAVLRAKSEEHPELRRRLCWPGVQRICARENVALLRTVIPRPSMLVQWRGAWAILLSTKGNQRRHTWYAAHELAHLWLHHDPLGARAQRVYTFDDWSCPDPREDEAELAATWMLAGRAVRAFLENAAPPDESPRSKD